MGFARNSAINISNRKKEFLVERREKENNCKVRLEKFEKKNVFKQKK